MPLNRRVEKATVFKLIILHLKKVKLVYMGRKRERRHDLILLFDEKIKIRNINFVKSK